MRAAFASSADDELKRNGDLMVSELAKCQARTKNGYLSAFPVEWFDRLRDGVNVWAPFYTYHKIMAGHLDMYMLAGNEQALGTVEKMAGWVRGLADPLGEQQMQRVLQVEYGGMGEVLANLYAVTGKQEYLRLAQRFDKKSFFDPLAAHRDELKGLHVNTHVPQVIAAARLYEMTGDKRYWNIADYFWNEVTSERAYCTGGISNFEFWRTDPGVLSSQLSGDTAEDCCEYNMMKLTRHLFARSPQSRYMDYYERLLFNHRIGTIDPETGTTVYFLPVGGGYSKIFAKPFDSFWCCSGTGAEEFAKLTDSIYFHDANSVYVNLYVASDLLRRFKRRQAQEPSRVFCPHRDSSHLHCAGWRRGNQRRRGIGGWRRRLGDLSAAFVSHRHRAGTRSYGSSYLCIPLQPLQLGTHFGGVLITQFPILLQRLIDDVFQFGRYIGI